MTKAEQPAVELVRVSGEQSAFERALARHGSILPHIDRPMDLVGVVVGFHLPFVPDFLKDHTLLGDTDAARLAEVLERQIQFVGNLWKWQSAAFSLRLLHNADTRTIEMALLARIHCSPGNEDEAATHLSSDLAQLLSAYEFLPQPLTSTADLNRFLSPLDDAPSQHEQSRIWPPLVEVRQREDTIPLSWTDGEVYVVYPYWRSAGTMAQFLAAAVRSGDSCVVNLHLEPTRLTAGEREKLGQAAALSATASDWQRQGFSPQHSGRWADPQAGIIADIYRRQLSRLARPFIVVAQVASTNQYTAVNLGALLGSSFTAGNTNLTETDPPASSYDLVYPESEDDSRAAWRIMQSLDFTIWGESLALESPELARMRYLADASGAAALFRFPVAPASGLAGIEVRQTLPYFDPGHTLTSALDSRIHLGELHSGGAVSIAIDDLTRHGLIAGLPGSGKTNTCLYLVSQLHAAGIPFMVLEPAKAEYRGLTQQSDFDSLMVYTLGDETTAPFRLNPFELLPGIRLEVHLEALNTAINASMPQFGILPSIIEEALEEVYAQHGWGPTDQVDPDQVRLFPTMIEFYRTATRVVEERGYQGEFHGNLSAAIKGRIGSLLRGSKGMMFNTRRSISMRDLFDRPVVLEMESLSDDTKALTMFFLLIFLREYRQIQHRQRHMNASVSDGARLRHLLLIEEAHRIMENVAAVGNPEVAADTRAAAVRMASSFVVEMRGYGQGVLIADQSPEKLTPDAVRNTNLKIGHMLPGEQDRRALAAAMVMDDYQEEYLGKLNVGEAAVFMTGLQKASFLAVPPFKNQTQFVDFLDDEAVRDHMQQHDRRRGFDVLPFDGCRFCTAQCDYRALVEPMTLQKRLVLGLHEALSQFNDRPEREHWDDNWRMIAERCLDTATHAGAGDSIDAAYCFFVHEIDFPFTEHMRLSFVRAAESVRDSGTYTVGEV